MYKIVPTPPVCLYAQFFQSSLHNLADLNLTNEKIEVNHSEHSKIAELEVAHKTATAYTRLNKHTCIAWIH